MKTAIFIAASLVAIAANAQQVYRCGNTYSQQPCDGGAVVKVDDARAPGAAAAQAAETKREQKAADAMEKSRLREEAKAAPASVMQHTKQEPPAGKKAQPEPKKDAKKQAKKPDYFTAVTPKKPGEAPAKKKKKSA